MLGDATEPLPTAAWEVGAFRRKMAPLEWVYTPDACIVLSLHPAGFRQRGAVLLSLNPPSGFGGSGTLSDRLQRQKDVRPIVCVCVGIRGCSCASASVPSALVSPCLLL